MYETFHELPFERGRATVTAANVAGPGPVTTIRYTARLFPDGGREPTERHFSDGAECMRALRAELGPFEPERIHPRNRKASDVEVVTCRVTRLALMAHCGLTEVRVDVPRAA